ncbi:MAG: cell filamentation protein Fic [Planctomycetes bacterium GWF2_41_51]|nr:MAG: cell filamentation protein Fic [Planctomycetes bacterium GWF2_41_51]HBG26733.1 cell filamentation protein Fic [Phycisphaerales bacterium]
MKRSRTGQYVTISTVGEKVKAFIPDAMPPSPPLEISPNLQESIDRALLALGRLDSISILLPDTSLFLYMYIRKEAVLSSQIEGTQSSLSDLLLFEMDAAPGVPLDDVQEVSNYVAAINHGLKRIREGFPISVRLIKEIHNVLLSKGRGSNKEPGQFRKSQNWLGGTRPGNAVFVPPPPGEVNQCMSDLEKFIHNKPQKISTLIKSALLHVQFESIHPFLDGNGRVGRLLITLLLCAEGILKEPMLYPSLYFKTNREQYYTLLQTVRTQGDWERWIEFFANAVRETAESAVKTANQLREVAEKDRKEIQSIGRAAGSALRVHQALLQKPVISIPIACKLSGLWTTSVTMVMKQFEKLGIVKEITGGRRNRLYSYINYMKILNKGMEQ